MYGKQYRPNSIDQRPMKSHVSSRTRNLHLSDACVEQGVCKSGALRGTGQA